LQIWLPPVAGREYIVAVDSAGGGEDGDFAAVQVVELATGLQCAELQQRLRPEVLARAAAELATEYNRGVVAVERNNHGAAVLAYLETREHYDRVWCAGSGRQRGEPGWLTTAASKPEMIARLGSLLMESPERFSSRRLLAECRTFVASPHGATGAVSGAHDDLVMAMAVAQAVRAEVLSRRRLAA
jgi:pyrroline-5-carboxylate reductase